MHIVKKLIAKLRNYSVKLTFVAKIRLFFAELGKRWQIFEILQKNTNWAKKCNAFEKNVKFW